MKWRFLLAICVLLIPRLAGAQAVLSSSGFTGIYPLGLDLGALAYYGPPVDYAQNMLSNPGFEPSVSGRVIAVPSGAGLSSTTFCDNSNGYNEPASFYNSTTFEDIYNNSGTATVRGTGTITGYAVSGTSCAAGSTYPEFTYSAGFTIVAGDYIRFSAAGNLVGNGTYAPGSWWNSDSAITLTADPRTGSSGIQSLAFALNGSAHTISSFIDATLSGYTGTASNYLLVTGNWTVSCWEKAVGATSPTVQLEFVRSGTTFINQTDTPTTSWALYTHTFTGSETSLTTNNNTATFTITANGSAGSIHVDDCFLGPTTASAGSWTPDLTTALTKLNVGELRMDESGDMPGNTYANYIAGDQARGPATNAGGTTESWTYNVDQFFQLCQRIDAIPWIIVPVVLTTSQYNSLGAYLATEETTYGFSKILVEWGNEMWNAGQCNGACYNTNSSVFSLYEQHDYAAIKSGAGSPTWLQLVGASQYEVGNTSSGGGPVSQVLTNCTSCTYAAGAPYYLNSLTTGTTASHMTQLFAAIQSAANYIATTFGVPMTLYEGGPTTYNSGTASEAEINNVVSGAGSATADGFNTLNAWSGDVPIQNEYQLGQVSFNPNNGTGYTGINIWGIDLTLPTVGINPIQRPRSLAMQLLNNYFLTNPSGTFYATSTNSYTGGSIGNSGATVGCWKSSAGLWNCAIANTSASSQNIIIQWPSAQTNLPTGTVKQVNFTSTIEDTNENGTINVTLGNGGTVTNNSSTEITVPVPAYGLAVALAATPSGATSGQAPFPGSSNQ